MLLDSIKKLIEKNISEYNSKLVEKYNLDIEELQTLWNQVSEDSEVPKKTKRKKKEETEEDDSKVSKKDKNDKTSVKGGCCYVFIKGKNEGETCNLKPKDNGSYCSRHAKFEGTGQKDKKKIPTASGKKTISDKNKQVKEKTSISEKPKIIIRLNKDIDKYWNPETCLVFKSKDERIVISSYRDSKLEKLNDDDIVVCEKYGFKYEKV